MNNSISVVINTYNASKYLARVLETVKTFDEIVVCDMESTDATVEIAQGYGCKIVTFPKGDCKSAEPARTFAIQSASSDWVLVVDADELVPQALRDYLYDFVQHPDDIRGLYIPRKNYTMNKFLPSSYPDYQLRFFIREGTEWPPYVHTFPVVKGKTSHVPKSRKDLAFEHLDDSTHASIVRLNNYTDNEVEKRAGTRVTLFKMIFSPFIRFCKMYFLKGGIFYGVSGYVYAKRSAIYKFTVLSKLYEKQIGMK
ncbi:MAG: glycosyltransferase family 2 protein [Muribaculaceae bacterium]|nr:glycosyltransferase family 2 protein [Muribaculaceae bacterium]